MLMHHALLGIFGHCVLGFVLCLFLGDMIDLVTRSLLGVVLDLVLGLCIGADVLSGYGRYGSGGKNTGNQQG